LREIGEKEADKQRAAVNPIMLNMLDEDRDWSAELDEIPENPPAPDEESNDYVSGQYYSEDEGAPAPAEPKKEVIEVSDDSSSSSMTEFDEMGDPLYVHRTPEEQKRINRSVGHINYEGRLAKAKKGLLWNGKRGVVNKWWDKGTTIPRSDRSLPPSTGSFLDSPPPRPEKVKGWKKEVVEDKGWDFIQTPKYKTSLEGLRGRRRP
jgi:hypothetical protein